MYQSPSMLVKHGETFDLIQGRGDSEFRGFKKCGCHHVLCLESAFIHTCLQESVRKTNSAALRAISVPLR